MDIEQIIKKMVDSLHNNGDYTHYHKKHIACICYNILADAPIRWVGKYNSYPIPHFDMNKGFGGYKINLDLIDWDYSKFHHDIEEGTIRVAITDAIKNKSQQ